MLSKNYNSYKISRSHEGVKWRLAERVSRILSDADSVADDVSGERVVRVSVGGLGEVSPVLWMREQRVFPKTYWSGREDGTEVAAVGVADETGETGDGAATGSATGSATGAATLTAPPTTALKATLGKKLSLSGGARYYGGLRFDAGRETAAEWEAFGAHRFVLPRFEVVRDAGKSRNGDSGNGDSENGSNSLNVSLVCNLVLPRDVDKKDEIMAQIEGLVSPPEGLEFSLPRLVRRTDGPDFEGWRRNIGRSISAFEDGEMDKVVLARRAGFVFETDLDAALLFASLREATPGCFHFYVEPEEGEVFVGASPERLYRREGRAVKSEAVAGTRPRGDSEADDRDLRDDLLASRKDRDEHGYVRVGIEENLRPLCDALQVEEGVSEMKGASRRHLVSKVRGTLREDADDADVLAALHPTPAVGGYPREKAVAEIREMEDFDRGWYAGAIGWIGSDGIGSDGIGSDGIGSEGAEFAVGIRSGLVRGKELALFSGAGIVAGSTPEAEWAEIEQKISDFIAVLGLRREHAAR